MQEKVKAGKMRAAPENATQLRGFLWLTGLYRFSDVLWKAFHKMPMHYCFANQRSAMEMGSCKRYRLPNSKGDVVSYTSIQLGRPFKNLGTMGQW